jgi:hypothetical protein
MEILAPNHRISWLLSLHGTVPRKPQMQRNPRCCLFLTQNPGHFRPKAREATAGNENKSRPLRQENRCELENFDQLGAGPANTHTRDAKSNRSISRLRSILASVGCRDSFFEGSCTTSSGSPSKSHAPLSETSGLETPTTLFASRRVSGAGAFFQVFGNLRPLPRSARRSQVHCLERANGSLASQTALNTGTTCARS